jgi:hypothetical protein
MRLEHLRCPLRMLLMNSPVLKRDCSHPVHLLNFDHSFFMNVPNVQEIAHDQISPLIANSAGDLQPLVVAMIRGQERERARILKGIHDEISPHLLSAVFLAQILKEKLEGKERDESDMATRLSKVLIKVIDGLVEVLDPPHCESQLASLEDHLECAGQRGLGQRLRAEPFDV